jgi:hypothetical protein
MHMLTRRSRASVDLAPPPVNNRDLNYSGLLLLSTYSVRTLKLDFDPPFSLSSPSYLS